MDVNSATQCRRVLEGRVTVVPCSAAPAITPPCGLEKEGRHSLDAF